MAASQEDIVEAKRYARCIGTTALRRLRTAGQRPARSWPPISSIPQTSLERLALDEKPYTITEDELSSNQATVLYLAYGSNLSAETFLGVRGIRPLSQINVSVPTLRLTFDLPGQPYQEPCFANVAFRKLPDKPKIPDPRDPRGPPPNLPPVNPPHGTPTWDGGLIGVVYEVTQKDWGTIMATEGGGSAYHEIVVPCIPIPPKFNVPEKPPIPELPKPIFARTLFAPWIPEDKLPDDPRKKHWWYRFVMPPHRPDPEYAQASARYLKLIMDGAREHELPDYYQDWLKSQQPYTITSRRQEIGKLLFALLWMPLLLFIMFLAPAFANKNGALPPWLATTIVVSMNLVWMSYDNIFKKVFGDGERTEDEDEKRRRKQKLRQKTLEFASETEKLSLMSRDW